MSEKDPKQMSLIERLRAENPNRNIVDVAVRKLDRPEEMTQFLIQYANYLEHESQYPEARAHPFDSAVKLIDRMATLHGGEVASRWHELIDTGTLQNPPDHSFDCMYPNR